MTVMRAPSIHSVRALVGLVAVPVLAVAGCGEDSDPPAGTGGAEPAAGAESMSISIEAPADGAEVPGEFEVSLSPSVEVGEPDTGLHHVHLIYDGVTAEGEYDMVFGPTATVSGLEPGEHTIEAVVVNADHSPTDARAEITVQVTGSGTGGAGTPTTAIDYGY
jgi:hypothetical protein